MMLTLDKYMTLGLAALVLLAGRMLRRRIPLLVKYCIPAPVTGGLVFSAINFTLHTAGIMTLHFDFLFQDLFMVIFFTTVGFDASLKTLRAGGRDVFKFLAIAVGLIFLQNGLSLVLARPLGISPELAMMTGSTPLTGGVGTSAAIAPDLESKGILGAHTVAITSATFAILMGSIMGGPIADMLIKKKSLFNRKPAAETITEKDSAQPPGNGFLNSELLGTAILLILYAILLGTFITYGLNALAGHFIESIKFPIYIGPMLAASLIRNMLDRKGASRTPMKEIKASGDISLNIFLSLALMSLKLWQLAGLALPLIILLAAQAVLMAVYAYIVSFRVMGRSYDSAVIAAGFCGFGMGTVANGVANMSAVCEKYEYSPLAFFVIPIVGSLFIDFLNIIIITGTLAFL